jgi:16S rRNA (uracil1498-N3)-methyltransferase
MSRRRFYVPADSIQGDFVCLPADQAHHLRDVLRLGSGEIVEIFDGTGNGYIGEVEIRDSKVLVQNLQMVSIENPRMRLILAAALIKSARYEWILQKATELGVHEIVPLKTRLSEIDIPSGKIALRLERWDRIVREAAKQSRRYSAPRVHAPKSFRDFLSNEELSSIPRLLFYEKAPELWRPDFGISGSDRMVLCIGPEGGWDTAEVEQAKQSGYVVFSLGPQTLRAETAAIAAVAIVQHQINILNTAS